MGVHQDETRMALDYLERLQAVYRDAISARDAVEVAKRDYEDNKQRVGSAQRKRTLEQAQALFSTAKAEVKREEIHL